MKEFIKALKKLFKQKKGFTLIELLVVIGILGVLAAMLVATIDPFEQIKKAQDSSVQNTAVEFQDAMIRYYTAQTGFPWDSNSDDGTACKTNVASSYTAPDPTAGGGTLTAVTLDTLDKGAPKSGCISELIKTGELKTGFLTQQGVLKQVYVSSPDLSNKTIQVCYKPLSKAGQNDKNANWIEDTTTQTWKQEDMSIVTKDNATCPTDGAVFDATHFCWWCTE